MLLSAMASLWHWTQREDRTAQNISVGYWQVSRVYALLGQADNARHYARQSLELAQSGGLAPFFIGYAYEGLARAELIAGNESAARKYRQEAQRLAAQVNDAEDKQVLLKDLNALAV